MRNVSALRTPWKEVALPVPNIIVTCLGRAEGKMGVGGWLLHAVFFFWGSQVVPEAELLLRKTPRRKEHIFWILIPTMCLPFWETLVYVWCLAVASSGFF